MPNSLWDMFQPQDAAGQPTDLGGALTGRSNSLIGLGLGLLSPSNPLRGQSSWGQGLEGFQAGAQVDARTAAEAARLRHQKSQDARQAAMDKFNMGMRQKEFDRGGETPYQKMQRDLTDAAGTPNEQTVRDFYRSQLDAGPPQTREIFDQTLGRNVVQEWDSRSKQYKTATTGGGAVEPPPADPFTVGRGQPVYGSGGSYSAAPAAAPGAAAGPQPVLPARKPLTAHEQTTIDTADKAVLANKGVIGTLQDAKRLSATAFSGPFTTERAQIGAQIPDYLPGMDSNQRAKDTLLLNNAVISQAVEQLKATFGGNPSEGERKILLDLAGSVNSPPDVREKIYDNAIKAATEKLALNERQSREIRGGTYYTPGGGAAAPAPAPAPGSAATPTATPSAAPRPGTVIKGYVYKGGDPSDEKNWAPVR